MEKCSKVKNPCKICLSSVTNKNGIQCQGACKKWAHYTCLNYTPGKIQDIKSGVITITCPCPDCVTEEPKEFLTNPPYSCTNHQCPANNYPICDKDDCPTKRSNPVSATQPVSSESSLETSDEVTPPASAVRLPASREPRYVPNPPQKPPAKPVRLANVPCGPTAPCAKKTLLKDPPMKPPPCPILTPCPSKDGKKALRPQPCSCRSKQPPPTMHQCPSGVKLQMIPSSDSSACPPLPSGTEFPCASSESSALIIPPCPIIKPACPVGQMKKTKSCSCTCKDSDSKLKLLKSSSEMNVSSTNSMYVTMQEMCNTVGQLSTQLKQLMCKMMDTVPNTF